MEAKVHAIFSPSLTYQTTDWLNSNKFMFYHELLSSTLVKR